MTFFLALLFSSALSQQLPEWWAKVQPLAEQTPVEERKARQRALLFNGAEGEMRLQHMLMAIALRPQDARGPVFLIEEAAAGEDREAATAFVRDLYRRNAGTESEAALQWQSGYAELLLTLGQDEEALRLQRPVVEQLPEQYKRVLLGVIEAVNGDTRPLARLFADCPEGGDADCRMTAVSIANRVQDHRGRDTPKAILDILAGRIAPTELSWEDRLRGLHVMATNDPEHAEPELQAVVANADAPEWAKNSAVLALARLYREDESESLAWIDCWFRRTGITFPEVHEGTWQELHAFMAARPDGRDEPTTDWSCSPLEIGPATEFTLTSNCTADLLMRRATLVANLEDVTLQRETAEQAVAVTLARKRAVPLLEVILQFAATENEDLRAMQYVGSLKHPWQAWPPEVHEAVRRQTARVLSPWDSPVKAKARPFAMCGQ